MLPFNAKKCLKTAEFSGLYYSLPHFSAPIKGGGANVFYLSDGKIPDRLLNQNILLLF